MTNSINDIGMKHVIFCIDAPRRWRTRVEKDNCEWQTAFSHCAARSPGVHVLENRIAEGFARNPCDGVIFLCLSGVDDAAETFLSSIRTDHRHGDR